MSDPAGWLLIGLTGMVAGALFGFIVGQVQPAIEPEVDRTEVAESFARFMHPGSVLRVGCSETPGDASWCTVISEAGDTRYTYQLTCDNQWCRIDSTVYY